MNFQFFIQSILLGIGLAADACAVSMTNGLNEPMMKKTKMSFVALMYAFFQFLMPLIGFFCVHYIANQFHKFEKFIPWIALVLLLYIGGKMLIEGIKHKDEKEEVAKKLTLGVLIVQGIATSIDALSVGFTISSYTWIMAIISCLIIGVVTFFISIGGIYLGKKVGTKLSNKAEIVGGIILICIGLEIFITSFF